jgi:hypothetical protein
VIKDLRQGDGQSFLLPATQWLMSRRKHVDSKKLLDNGLWLCTFSQIAAAAQRLAIVEGGWASGAPGNDVISMHQVERYRSFAKRTELSLSLVRVPNVTASEGSSGVEVGHRQILDLE